MVLCDDCTRKIVPEEGLHHCEECEEDYCKMCSISRQDLTKVVEAGPFALNKEIPMDTFGLWILIRTDLGMTKGKICAQTAHAVLAVYKDLSNPVDFRPKHEGEDDQHPGDEILLAQWTSLDYPKHTFAASSI